MALLSLAVVSVLIGMAMSWSGCPRPEDMLPCTCIRPRGYTKVTCNGSKQEIKDGLDILSRYWMGVDDVVIISNEIEVLEDRAFGMMDLHMLEMTTPNLKFIAKDAFRTNERSFNHLRIHESSIRSLDDVLPALRYIFRLYTLLINNSPDFTKIPANAFTDALETVIMNNLDLKNNGISAIGEKAFDPLVNLLYVTLSGNKISAFAPSAIHYPGNKLRILNLM